MAHTATTAVTRQTVGSDELWFALDALIVLQASYAKRLNVYEGRHQRRVFESAEAFIARLRVIELVEG